MFLHFCFSVTILTYVNGDEKNLLFPTGLQKLRYTLELIPYHQAQTAS